MFLPAAANCGDEHPVRGKPVRAADVAEQINQNEQPVYAGCSLLYNEIDVVFFVAPCLIMRYNVNKIL